VLRRDVGPDHVVVEPSVALDRPRGEAQAPVRGEDRLARNVAYVAQLVVLRAWYRTVRVARLPPAAVPDEREPLVAAIRVLDGAIEERLRRLQAFGDEAGLPRPRLAVDADASAPPCPLPLTREGDHLAWLAGLQSPELDAGRTWLAQIAERVVNPVR
jgi:hypothetical protein